MILVATAEGLRKFTRGTASNVELPGRSIGPLAREADGSCVAIVDQQEIWRRSQTGVWSRVATTKFSLQSVIAAADTVFAGGMDEAIVFRIHDKGQPERLSGFDAVPGREQWFAGGPPLGVRGLAMTSGGTLFAAVHVGGMPRSVDKGETWTPTIPVVFDVHEVRAHPSRFSVVAAAAAVGLCISMDGGVNWRVFSEGLLHALATDHSTCLAVAVLEEEVLFSVQDGPFAERSQIWRWRIGSDSIYPVCDGLPEWMEGKVDTNCLVAGCGTAAVLDGGGNLWHSEQGSTDWRLIAQGLPYSYGIAIL